MGENRLDDEKTSHFWRKPAVTHEQHPIYARVRRFRLAKGAKFQQDLGRCESYLGDVGE
jgi:hypothetical protein